MTCLKACPIRNNNNILYDWKQVPLSILRKEEEESPANYSAGRCTSVPRRKMKQSLLANDLQAHKE